MTDTTATQEELLRVERLLRAFRFHFTTEAELQRQIAAALERVHQAFEREHSLGPAGRIDFLVGQVGIEVKIKGSVTEVGWQLQRYAEHVEVAGLLLITARAQHRELPTMLNDKPLRVFHLIRL